jgi:hypothetical protein
MSSETTSLSTSIEVEKRMEDDFDQAALAHPSNVDEEKARSIASSPTDYEVNFLGDDDPRNPRAIPTFRKWIYVLIISSTSLCVTCTSSLYTATYGQIQKEFHTSNIVATLGLSMFVVGLGISPMILAPLSEVCTNYSSYNLITPINKQLVLWQKTCVYLFNALFRNLDHPLRSGTEYYHHDCSSVF